MSIQTIWKQLAKQFTARKKSASTGAKKAIKV
jgi:hypothetical protein